MGTRRYAYFRNVYFRNAFNNDIANLIINPTRPKVNKNSRKNVIIRFTSKKH